MALLDEWAEIPLEHPQTLSGHHVSSAWQSLSELEEGIVNSETTLRDTIGTVNFMQKSASLVGIQKSIPWCIRFRIIFLIYHDFSTVSQKMENLM